MSCRDIYSADHDPQPPSTLPRQSPAGHPLRRGFRHRITPARPVLIKAGLSGTGSRTRSLADEPTATKPSLNPTLPSQSCKANGGARPSICWADPFPPAPAVVGCGRLVRGQTPTPLGASVRSVPLYRSGRSPDWLKMKNPAAPAVKREAEEVWDKWTYGSTTVFRGKDSGLIRFQRRCREFRVKWLPDGRAPRDLSHLNLREARLSGAHLSRREMSLTDLRRADLGGAWLTDSSFMGANLEGANLKGAYLTGANLVSANLSGANLSGANLYGTHFDGAHLAGSNLSGAELKQTIFAGTVLREVEGLELCVHSGPSFIDFQSLQYSWPLPLTFLRGIGLPDSLIDYLPSLFNQAIQHYSCFISHSSKDQAFAERLHADLQNKGVRCWFAPHDMPIWGEDHRCYR